MKAGDFLLGEGELLEVDPPRRLVQTMRALWSNEAKEEGFSRVTWEIEPVGDSCRLVHDRWVSKYAEPWAAGLTGMKHELEDQMEKVFEIYIRTTPERLWEAITDPAIRAKYHFGAAVESDWTAGSPYRLGHPAAERPLIEGENLVVERPNRLVQTMRALWGPEAERTGTSRVTWEIEPVGDSCRLTVIHDQLPPDAPAELYGGWPMILSGLKTWLETGQTLTTPGSLMYQPQQ